MESLMLFLYCPYTKCNGKLITESKQEAVQMKSKELFKEFIQYVALNILGMIGLSCYILADTFLFLMVWVQMD